jgi:hypothetical protein
MDSTGFIKQLLAKMPPPNNYEAAGSDGLNTAGHRWVCAFRGGNEGIFSFGGTGVERKQINVPARWDRSLSTTTCKTPKAGRMGRLQDLRGEGSPPSLE